MGNRIGGWAQRQTKNINTALYFGAVAALVFSSSAAMLPAETVQASHPGTVYVNANSDGNGDGSQDSPFDTIQKGVKHADSSEIVEVWPGNYNEQVTLSKQDLTLISKSGPTETTIKGDHERPTVEVLASGVTVEGFEITGNGGNREAGQGVSVSNNQGKSLQYVTLRDLNVHDVGDKGIVVDFSVNTEIDNVEVHNNSGDEGITIWKSDNTTISNSEVYDNGSAADDSSELDPGIFVNGNGTTILNLEAYSNADYGVAINNKSTWEYQDTPGIDMTIENSNFHSNTAGAVGIFKNEGNVAVNKSNFEGNSGVNASGSGKVDATKNWWDSRQGPSGDEGEGNTGGASVSANVDYQPWLCSQAPEGNPSENGSCDKKAPDVFLTAPSAGPINGEVEVRGTIQDNNKFHYYAVLRDENDEVVDPQSPRTEPDNQADTFESFSDKKLFSFNTEDLQEGSTYTIFLAARDKAENRNSGSEDSIQITIDDTPPKNIQTVFTERSSDNSISSNSVTDSEKFTFDLSADGKPVRWKLKYWNDIEDSNYNKDETGNVWNPKNLRAAGKSPELGVYKDLFTQGEGVHYFAFSACDAAGNCSGYQQEPFQITYDETPEDTLFWVEENSDEILVEWKRVEEAKKYHVYRSDDYSTPITTEGAVDAESTSLSYVDSSVSTGDEYEYKVTVEDEAGNETDLSNVTPRYGKTLDIVIDGDAKGDDRGDDGTVSEGGDWKTYTVDGSHPELIANTTGGDIHGTAGGSNDQTFTWTTGEITQDADYEVFANYLCHTKRPAATYNVYAGETQVGEPQEIDQSLLGGQETACERQFSSNTESQWASLGTFSFEAAQNVAIELEAPNEGGNVVADAVGFNLIESTEDDEQPPEDSEGTGDEGTDDTGEDTNDTEEESSGGNTGDSSNDQEDEATLLPANQQFGQGQVLAAQTQGSEQDQDGDENTENEEDGEVLQETTDGSQAENEQEDENAQATAEDTNLWWWILLIALLVLAGGSYLYWNRTRSTQK